MVVIWPGARGPRLWLPVLPLLVGYLADGAGGLGALRGGLGRARPYLVGVACAMILTNGVLAGAWRVIDDWRACNRAVHGVLLTGAPLAVAGFANDWRGRRMVLAYGRYLEIMPAVMNPDVTLVALPRTGGLAGLRDMGVTHVALPVRGGKREPEGLRDLLRADPVFESDAATVHTMRQESR